MHEQGDVAEKGEGSIGWRYKWSEEESLKLILRTHTTAVSSKMLYTLAQKVKRDGQYNSNYASSSFSFYLFISYSGSWLYSSVEWAPTNNSFISNSVISNSFLLNYGLRLLVIS